MILLWAWMALLSGLGPTGHALGHGGSPSPGGRIEAAEPRFGTFANRFRMASFPIWVPDAAVGPKPKGRRIPVEEAQAFICGVQGSDWVCVEESGDPDMDYNTLGHYRAWLRYKLPHGEIVLCYSLHYLGYGTLYMATHAADGALIHRAMIAGHEGDYKLRSARLSAQGVVDVTEREYRSKSDYSPEGLKLVRKWHYRWSGHEWEVATDLFEDEAARKALGE